MQNYIGKQFGNFIIQKKLGEGGFAEVFQAQHNRLHDFVAVKILKPALSDTEKQGFEKEAQTMAKLKHRHIIPLKDYGLQENIAYIVMELAEKGTLRTIHPPAMVVPPPLILTYVQQIAEALHFVHSQKLVHCDIKPQNLLVRANDDILLGDFGIATDAITNSHRLQQKTTGMEQTVVGTVEYIAPEQWLGQPPTHATDQYSLAIVIYAWLCGRHPFVGRNPQTLAHMHINQAPPPLPLQTVSRTLEQVVLKALAKDPHNRYPSIRAFADALEKAITTTHPNNPHRVSISPASPVLPIPSSPPTSLPPPSTLPNSPSEVTLPQHQTPQSPSPVPSQQPLVQPQQPQVQKVNAIFGSKPTLSLKQQSLIPPAPANSIPQSASPYQQPHQTPPSYPQPPLSQQQPPPIPDPGQIPPHLSSPRHNAIFGQISADPGFHSSTTRRHIFGQYPSRGSQKPDFRTTRKKKQQTFDVGLLFYRENMIFFSGGAFIDLLCSIVIGILYSRGNEWVASLNIGSLFFILTLGLRFLCTIVATRVIARPIAWLLTAYWVVGITIFLFLINFGFYLIILVVAVVAWIVQDIFYARHKK